MKNQAQASAARIACRIFRIRIFSRHSFFILIKAKTANTMHIKIKLMLCDSTKPQYPTASQIQRRLSLYIV